MFSVDVTIVLGIICLLEFCLIIGALFLLFRWGRKILALGEIIEESLDIFDERYSSISQILQIPLFHDSAQIRQVLADVDACRDAVLRIANMLGNIELIEDE
jgi:uncharacterized membrane protein